MAADRVVLTSGAGRLYRRRIDNRSVPLDHESGPMPGHVTHSGRMPPSATPVAVVWDKRLRRPVAFTWRHRRYRVQRVLHTWVVDTGWWDERLHVSRRYFRVRADGRIFDLAYDRLARRWTMAATLG